MNPIEALNFIAQTMSSDWPERCQESVRVAREALAATVAPAEPITVEAVAEVRDTDDGLTIDWLIEGGIDAMVPGCVLVCATRPITDDKGQGEVYLAPVAPAGDKPATSEPVATLHDDGRRAWECDEAIRARTKD